ncbi:hypothetical protein Tco_1032606 [Tanacetum coccineum]|uniref:Uncharacterized protein n=1 Tax=Tanacetum coccineum TaxID=301880 RepID=A0ABQ5GDS6_9ASTR
MSAGRGIIRPDKKSFKYVEPVRKKVEMDNLKGVEFHVQVKLMWSSKRHMMYLILTMADRRPQGTSEQSLLAWPRDGGTPAVTDGGRRCCPYTPEERVGWRIQLNSEQLAESSTESEKGQEIGQEDISEEQIAGGGEEGEEILRVGMGAVGCRAGEQDRKLRETEIGGQRYMSEKNENRKQRREERIGIGRRMENNSKGGYAVEVSVWKGIDDKVKTEIERVKNNGRGERESERMRNDVEGGSQRGQYKVWEGVDKRDIGRGKKAMISGKRMDRVGLEERVVEGEEVGEGLEETEEEGKKKRNEELELDVAFRTVDVRRIEPEWRKSDGRIVRKDERLEGMCPIDGIKEESWGDDDWRGTMLWKGRGRMGEGRERRIGERENGGTKDRMDRKCRIGAEEKSNRKGKKDGSEYRQQVRFATMYLSEVKRQIALERKLVVLVTTSAIVDASVRVDRGLFGEGGECMKGEQERRSEGLMIEDSMSIMEKKSLMARQYLERSKEGDGSHRRVSSDKKAAAQALTASADVPSSVTETTDTTSTLPPPPPPLQKPIGSFKDGDGDGDTHYERSHKGVKASANSDIIFFFTSAQDGNKLLDDERLSLADDLKKAHDQNQNKSK